MRTIVFWGLYRGTLILGNYNVGVIFFSELPKDPVKDPMLVV